MYWLLARNSQLILENKILLYQIILKHIWTYILGYCLKLQYWGRYQSKLLKIIMMANKWVFLLTKLPDHGFQSLRVIHAV